MARLIVYGLMASAEGRKVLEELERELAGVLNDIVEMTRKAMSRDMYERLRRLAKMVSDIIDELTPPGTTVFNNVVIDALGVVTVYIPPSLFVLKGGLPSAVVSRLRYIVIEPPLTPTAMGISINPDADRLVIEVVIHIGALAMVRYKAKIDPKSEAITVEHKETSGITPREFNPYSKDLIERVIKLVHSALDELTSSRFITNVMEDLDRLKPLAILSKTLP